jgi:hypothetical protein
VTFKPSNYDIYFIKVTNQNQIVISMIRSYIFKVFECSTLFSYLVITVLDRNMQGDWRVPRQLYDQILEVRRDQKPQCAHRLVPHLHQLGHVSVCVQGDFQSSSHFQHLFFHELRYFWITLYILTSACRAVHLEAPTASWHIQVLSYPRGLLKNLPADWTQPVSAYIACQVAIRPRLLALLALLQSKNLHNIKSKLQLSLTASGKLWRSHHVGEGGTCGGSN